MFERQGTAIDFVQALSPPTSLGTLAVPVHPDGFGTALAAVAASTTAQGAPRPAVLAASAIDISGQAQQGAVYVFSVDGAAQPRVALVATLTPPTEVRVRASWSGCDLTRRAGWEGVRLVSSHGTASELTASCACVAASPHGHRRRGRASASRWRSWKTMRSRSARQVSVGYVWLRCPCT